MLAIYPIILLYSFLLEIYFYCVVETYIFVIDIKFKVAIEKPIYLMVFLIASQLLVRNYATSKNPTIEPAMADHR